MTVHGIVKAGHALPGHFLADDVGGAGVQQALHLFGRQVTAVAVVPGGTSALGQLVLAHFLQPLRGAEAVVCLAGLHQLFGVLLEHPHPLRLHIGADRAADVGAFVPQKAGLAQGVVDDVHRTLHLAHLVGILNAQNEGAALALGFQVGVQCGTQVAHVHIARGAGGKTGTNSHDDSSLSLFHGGLKNEPPPAGKTF